MFAWRLLPPCYQQLRFSLQPAMLLLFSCLLSPAAAYQAEEPLLFDHFPADFRWGAATAAYQVRHTAWPDLAISFFSFYFYQFSLFFLRKKEEKNLIQIVYFSSLLNPIVICRLKEVGRLMGRVSTSGTSSPAKRGRSRTGRAVTWLVTLTTATGRMSS